jgi:hypothetical protein
MPCRATDLRRSCCWGRQRDLRYRGRDYWSAAVTESVTSVWTDCRGSGDAQPDEMLPQHWAAGCCLLLPTPLNLPSSAVGSLQTMTTLHHPPTCSWQQRAGLQHLSSYIFRTGHLCTQSLPSVSGSHHCLPHTCSWQQRAVVRIHGGCLQLVGLEGLARAGRQGLSLDLALGLRKRRDATYHTCII